MKRPELDEAGWKAAENVWLKSRPDDIGTMTALRGAIRAYLAASPAKAGDDDDLVKRLRLEFVAGSLNHYIAAFDAIRHEAADRLVALRAELERVTGQRFDFLAHLRRQREWSERTFGPGTREKGVVDHIRKELSEIEAEPGDLKEWIDVAILALDGAWRAGHSPEAILAQLVATQTRNEGRKWPDWRTMSADQAIEHDRSGE